MLWKLCSLLLLVYSRNSDGSKINFKLFKEKLEDHVIERLQNPPHTPQQNVEYSILPGFLSFISPTFSPSSGYGNYFWIPRSRVASVCLPIIATDEDYTTEDVQHSTQLNDPASIIQNAVNEKLNSKIHRVYKPHFNDNIQDCGRDGYSNVFQLDQDEQILIIGQAPPKPMPFFSFQHYLQYRYDRFGGWRQAFAALGDSINNHNLGTFVVNGEKLFILLITPSKDNAVNMAKILGDFKFDGIKNIDKINVLGVPQFLQKDGSSAISLGHSKHSDYFSIMMRYIYARENKFDNWFFHQSKSMFIARIVSREIIKEYNVKKVQVNPKPKRKNMFYAPNIVSRTISKKNHSDSESSLMSALSILSKRLERKLLKEKKTIWKNWLSIPGNYFFPNEWGGDCLNKWSFFWGSKCYGNTRDMTYYGMFPQLWLEFDDDLFIIGVNHEKTGKAKYSQLALIDMHYHIGINAVSMNETVNSAKQYLKNSIVEDIQDYLFVAKFSNFCTKDEPYCYSFFSDGEAFSLNFLRENNFVPTLPVVQSFLHPITGIGFDSTNDNNNNVVKPMYFVATRQKKIICNSNTNQLLCAVLDVLRFCITPYVLDWLLLFFVGQQYFLLLIFTYTVICICAASILNFPYRK